MMMSKIRIPRGTGCHSQTISVEEVPIEEYKEAAEKLVNFFMGSVSGSFVEEFVKAWYKYCTTREYFFCKKYNIKTECGECNKKFICWTEK
jgi:hypothetical protein